MIVISFGVHGDNRGFQEQRSVRQLLWMAFVFERSSTWRSAWSKEELSRTRAHPARAFHGWWSTTLVDHFFILR